MLLQHYHKENKEELLSYLVNEEEKAVANQEMALSTKVFFKGLELISKEDIKKIHYSWLAPEVSSYPEALKPYFLAIMPPYYKKGVSSLLKIEAPASSLSLPVQRFFLQLLQTKLKQKGLIQEESVESEKLSILEELTKQQLVEVIDFFALHDLAEDVRHIVDKEKLRKIYQILDEKRRQYLRQCLHYKHPHLSKKIGLDHWNGDGDLLSHVLHRRGLKKFACVLSTEKKVFLDRLCYRLDTGRGNFLKEQVSKKVFKEKESAELTVLLLKLVNFLKGKDQ